MASKIDFTGDFFVLSSVLH